jgi:pSer/pThr/pTyr-binding forkhead associated (FHA) protein
VSIPAEIHDVPSVLAPARPMPFATTESIEPLRPEQAPPLSPPPPAVAGRHLILEQDGERRLLPLTRPITRIGRGFGSTIQLEDKTVSRRHAIVMQRGERVRLLDDRSSNGTFVNGRRVLEAELSDGDVVLLGRVVLVYREPASGRQVS